MFFHNWYRFNEKSPNSYVEIFCDYLAVLFTASTIKSYHFKICMRSNNYNNNDDYNDDDDDDDNYTA